MGYYFDTVVTITGYCPASVLQAALDECARYEALLSKTREESDVWRINHAQGAAVTVSEDTLAILALSQDIAAESGGAFDITIAPESALWDFQAETPVLPATEALAQAASLVDYRLLIIKGNQVQLPAGHSVDLGGVAKGYIADALAAYLSARGVKSALLNFGGNVKVLGEKQGEVPWQIGIQDPAAEPGVSLATMALQSGWSLVSSGTYQRGFTKDGVRSPHIVDPDTGWPVQNGVAGTTILAQSSMLADALSTACFVLGPEKGMALAQSYGAQALFLTDAGERICTEEMEALLRLG
ncbi:MAG: FAD:protein FMN transferase [Candidatus Pelethousia sp.]|nr:FAD:protein FMN transferase [Candidatus Pelethousia sp.]